MMFERKWDGVLTFQNYVVSAHNKHRWINVIYDRACTACQIYAGSFAKSVGIGLIFNFTSS